VITDARLCREEKRRHCAIEMSERNADRVVVPATIRTRMRTRIGQATMRREVESKVEIFPESGRTERKIEDDKLESEWRREKKACWAANTFFAHKFPLEIGYRKNDVAIDPDAILSDRLAMRPFDVTLCPTRCVGIRNARRRCDALFGSRRLKPFAGATVNVKSPRHMQECRFFSSAFYTLT